MLPCVTTNINQLVLKEEENKCTAVGLVSLNIVQKIHVYQSIFSDDFNFL